MASIRHSLRRINSEFSLLLPEGDIVQACRDAGYAFRNRLLTPVLTVHLLILQLLDHASFRRLRATSGIRVTRQAFAAARQRLPLGVMIRLMEMLCDRACASLDSAADWLGHRLILMDGTCCRMPDAPELAGYGKARNQRGTNLGYPLIRLVAVIDYSTGLIRRVLTFPWPQQEIKTVARVFRHLNPGDLILADRGLISYAVAALMMRANLCFCARLPKKMIVHGRGKATRRRFKRLGRQDLLVRWTTQACPTWMSLRRFAGLPRELILRQISFRLCRKGCRPTWVWIITDRVDPQRYPAADLIALYERRWQVEVDLRDLNRTLGMKQLRSRSKEAVRKEVAGYIILYNLVRLTMLRSAKSQGLSPDRISFMDAADWLLLLPYDGELPDLEVNPRRRRKTQPRLIKFTRKYQRLKKPRRVLERPAYEARL